MTAEEKKLTPKQQRFVEEYLIDLNATQAAHRVGHELRLCSGKEKGFYVYLLTDSSSGEIFYIGKGKGKRFAAHEREWRAAKGRNTDKLSRIDEIVQSGCQVIAYCFAESLSEALAFALEAALISAIGRDRLTNLSPGTTTLAERVTTEARLRLGNIIPFDEWCGRRNPTENEKTLYRRVVAEYEFIASGEYGRQIELLAGVMAA